MLDGAISGGMLYNSLAGYRVTIIRLNACSGRCRKEFSVSEFPKGYFDTY